MLNVSDLVPLVGAVMDLMPRRLITNPPQLFDKITMIFSSGDPTILGALGEYAAFDRNIPDEVLERVCADHGFPAWRANLALYGPPEVLPGLLAVVKLKFDGTPGAKPTSRTATAPPGEYLMSSEVPRDFLP